MVTGFVRTAPEWRPQILRCRFTIEANPTPARLEAARNEAAERFTEDMRKQGWQLAGDFIGSSAPVPSPPKLDGKVHIITPLSETDTWEYEIAARFIRRLLPMEILATRPSQASRQDLLGVEHSHAKRDRRRPS